MLMCGYFDRYIEQEYVKNLVYGVGTAAKLLELIQ
jgi:hypothetical protein